MNTREFLKKSLDDQELKAILFGEYHMASFTDALIIANLDLFENCKRPIVFLSENFNQEDNPTLIAATNKKNPGLINTINAVKFLSSPSLFLITTILSHGLILRGAESKETNPFMNMDLDDIDPETERIYESSDERITLPNREFARVANEYIAKGYLIIFTGGAIHPIALTKGEKPFDQGMQGRIQGKSLSINLLEASRDTMQFNAAYHSTDRQFSGTYDLLIQSSEDSMYHQSFVDCKSLEEKKAKLNQILIALFKTREYFPKVGRTFDYFLNLVLRTFKASLDDPNLEFTALKQFANEPISNQTVSKKSFSSLFMRLFANKLQQLFINEPSLENSLKKLIDQDLAHQNATVIASAAKQSSLSP